MRQSGVLNFCCATFELLLCHQDTLSHNLPTARLRLQGRFAESFLLLLADANKAHTDTHQALQRAHCLKNLVHFSICACHPCAGAMLIFSVSFQFYRMIPEGESGKWCISYVHVVPAHATILHISKMTTTPFIFLATATPYRSLQDKSPNTIFIYTSHTHYSHYSTCASEKRAPNRRKSNGLRRRHLLRRRPAKPMGSLEEKKNM